MLQKFITHSEKETRMVGKELAQSLNGGVVAFFGDLGAGKTTFVRGMCEGLAYQGEVSSPTFAIVHEYVGGRVALYQFDMYRVESVDDLSACGFYDYLDQGILAIEWSENVLDALPKDAVIVRMTYGEQENDRIIEIERGDRK